MSAATGVSSTGVEPGELLQFVTELLQFLAARHQAHHFFAADLVLGECAVRTVPGSAA